MAKKAYIGVDNVARKIKKGYIGVESFTKRDLPSGYTQVEYIESSGTQYIDTGFKNNQNTRIVMDMQVTNKPSTHAWIFGGRNSGSLGARNVFLHSGTTWSVDYNSDSTRVQFSNLGITDRMTIDFNKNVFTMGSQTHTFTAATFQCSYNHCLLAQNDGGTVGNFISARIYSCQIYDNGTLVRDYVPCINPSDTVGLYDITNGTFYSNVGTGTFTAGGTSSHGVARKIKKAYIGVGGVARPFWSGGEVAYYGTITELSYPRSSMASTTVGNYALFTGGYYGSSQNRTTVETYNTSLTKGTATDLSKYRSDHKALTNGNHAIIGGGTTYTDVDSYNSSLTRSSIGSFQMNTAYYAGTTIGNYAMFAGGQTTGSTSTLRVHQTIMAYDLSLTRSQPTGLSVARSFLSATTVGEYALFAGGRDNPKTGNKTDVVDCYDASLTRTAATSLSCVKDAMESTTVGNYALFSGGEGPNSLGISPTYASIEAYDTSLTKVVVPDMSESKQQHAAITLGDYALFAGGYPNQTAVNVYDSSLTRTITTPLSVGRHRLSPAVIGNYALFVGGYDNSSRKGTVDVYTVV